MMLKIKSLVAISLLTLACNSQATIITVAADNANNYGNQWLGNGGTGFDEWHFITDSANGSAGTFLANKSGENDLNHIASNPSDNAWEATPMATALIKLKRIEVLPVIPFLR
ncbi:hypothetical protein [Psychrosphaera algicola]|uniref:Uncharacterized protein n=1 Tax=Psychrosphaera algicola TaxID=3023714 RepID=A0ABT5FDR5_9GAMM|nr:hypothetical protein [Psychrosphaera sp. G1-22]MDC2889003.1 hypothetical protein [Psychrosphaera sp. G1-22]